MSRIKYFVILLISLLILSGCDANVEITLNYEGKTTESIDVFDDNKNIIYGDKSVEDSIELVLEKYKTALSVGNYTSDIYTGKTKSGALIYREYDNICEMVKGTIFSQYLYSNIECTENEYFYEIKSIGDVVKNTDRYESWLAPENINLRINLPVSAEEQNADEIDGNTYVWKYNSNTQRDKSFYLKISKVSLENYNKEFLIEQEKKSQIKKMINIGIIILVIIILIFISVILYKKYKRNKLDY